MTRTMLAGDTFLVPDLDDHLWAVISDPLLDESKVVIVCLLSWQEHYDQACVLEAGDHPFITHSTCVNYPGARIEKNTLFEQLKSAGQLKPKDPLPDALLNRIREKAEDSDITSESYDVLRNQGFVG